MLKTEFLWNLATDWQNLSTKKRLIFQIIIISMINDNFFFIVNSTFQKTTFSVLKKSFYGCSNYPECKFTLAEHFRKKKLTKTNVKELLEGKETLVKGIKNKEKKPYNAVVKIGEKGYIDFISFSK